MARRVPVVRFEAALPHVYAVAVSTLTLAPNYEGLDPWIYVVRASLDDELRRDVDLLLGHLISPLLLLNLQQSSNVSDDFAAFIGWLTTLEDKQVKHCVEDLLGGLACPSHSGSTSMDVPRPDDRPALDAYLRQTGCGWSTLAVEAPQQFDQLLDLLQSPSDLKARLVFSLVRLWEEHFGQRLEEHLPGIRHSAAFHRQQQQEETLGVLFERVTGRSFEDGFSEWVEDAEEVVFIPSCFGGPYVQLHALAADRQRVALSYNYRVAGPTADVAGLRCMLPILRALADETRLAILANLDGQELYAQQLVERLDISQPAVSRHLALMVAAGLLQSRREGGMKFYSVCGEALGHIGEHLVKLGGIKSGTGMEVPAKG